MKKILFAALLSILAYYDSSAQFTGIDKQNHRNTFNELRTASFYDDDSTVVKDYNYYIRKSRNNRITGISLLGGGLLLGGAALLVAEAQSNNFNDDNDALIGAMFVFSAVAGLTSIPLMISAHANHNKAKAMLQTKKTGLGIPSGNKAITGISIAIPIGK